MKRQYDDFMATWKRLRGEKTRARRRSSGPAAEPVTGAGDASGRPRSRQAAVADLDDPLADVVVLGEQRHQRALPEEEARQIPVGWHVPGWGFGILADLVYLAGAAGVLPAAPAYVNAVATPKATTAPVSARRAASSST